MKPWEQFRRYAGLGWAADHHDVVVLDRQANRSSKPASHNSAETRQQLRQQLQHGSWLLQLILDPKPQTL